MSIPAATLVAEIGVDGETIAASKLVAFGARVDEASAKQVAGAARIGGAFHLLEGQLASFGVPFMDTLGRVGTTLERVEGQGAKFGSSLANLGRTESIAAVVGLAAVATEGVHLADDLEAAHARLETSVHNAGQEYGRYAGQISAADKRSEQLGFTNAETESSLARLEASTHSVAAALKLENIVMDVTRGRGIDVAASTQLVAQVEAGRYKGLIALGIATKEQVAGFKSSKDGLDLLSRAYGGQASAFADTFAGKQAVVVAELKDMGAELGQEVVPRIEQFVSGGIAGVHVLQDLNSATGGFVGKVGLVAAGLPIAVFGVQKLVEGGKSLGAMFYTTSAAASRQAQSELEVSAAQADAARTSALQAAAVRPLAVAQQVEAAAAREVVAADAALLEATTAVNAETGQLIATDAEVAVASNAAAAAQARYAAASDAVAVSTRAQSGETAVASGGLTAMGAGAIALTAGLVIATVGISRARAEEEKFSAAVRQNVQDLQAGGDAATRAGEALAGKYGPAVEHLTQEYLQNVLAGKQQTLSAKELSAAIIALGGVNLVTGGKAKALGQALHDATAEMGGAELVSAKLAAAQKQLADDVIAASHGDGAAQQRLAGDKSAVTAASKEQSVAQNAVNEATAAGTDSSIGNGEALTQQKSDAEALADSLRRLTDGQLAVASADLAVQKGKLDLAAAYDTYRHAGQTAEIAVADGLDQVRSAQDALTRDKQTAAGVGEQAVSAARQEASSRQSLSNAIQSERDATTSLQEAKEKLAQFEGPTDTRIRTLERQQIVNRVITNPEEARQKEIDLLKFDEDTANKRGDLQKQVTSAERGVVSATQQVANAQQSVSDAVTARRKVQSDAAAAIYADERKLETALIAYEGDIAKAATASQVALLGLDSTLLGQVQLAEDAARKQADLGKYTDSTAKSIAEEKAAHKAGAIEIENLKRQYPQLTGVIEEYGRQLGLLPDTVKTTVTIDLTQAMTAIAWTQAALRGLGTIDTTSGTTGQTVGAAIHTKAFAAGGWVDAPEGTAVPATLHGREYVVSRDELQGRPRPDSPVPALAGALTTAPPAEGDVAQQRVASVTAHVNARVTVDNGDALTALLKSAPTGDAALSNRQPRDLLDGGADHADLLTQIRDAIATQKPPIHAPQTNHFHGVESPLSDLDYAGRALAWEVQLLTSR